MGSSLALKTSSSPVSAQKRHRPRPAAPGRAGVSNNDGIASGRSEKNRKGDEKRGQIYYSEHFFAFFGK